MNDPVQPPQRSEPGRTVELFHRVRASIEATHAPAGSPRKRIAAAVVGALLASTAILMAASQAVYGQFAAGLESNAPSSSHLQLVLALLIGLTVTATIAPLERGRRGLGAAALTLAIVSGLVAPVYAVLVAVNPVHAHEVRPALLAISPWGARCLLVALMIGVLVLSSFAFALRRSVPAASGFRGAALGAAAGAWAGLGVFIFCPVGSHQHLLTGHVLPVAVLTLAGLLFVPRMLRP
jgi:hypothetical protein